MKNNIANMVHSIDAYIINNRKTLILSKAKVMDQIDSTCDWEQYTSKIWEHNKRHVALIRAKKQDDNLKYVIVTLESGQLVMDWVLPGLEPIDVKALLDKGDSTGSFCTLGNAMFRTMDGTLRDTFCVLDYLDEEV